jgi:hypothetical protein
MNAPQFVISGRERREKKRELASLRYAITMFWHWEDCNTVYGCELERNAAHKVYERLKSEAKELERLLSRKIGEQ